MSHEIFLQNKNLNNTYNKNWNGIFSLKNYIFVDNIIIF